MNYDCCLDSVKQVRPSVLWHADLLQTASYTIQISVEKDSSKSKPNHFEIYLWVTMHSVKQHTDILCHMCMF